jgi:hypothetical protein
MKEAFERAAEIRERNNRINDWIKNVKDK